MQTLKPFPLAKVRIPLPDIMEKFSQISNYHAETRAGNPNQFNTLAINNLDKSWMEQSIRNALSSLCTEVGSILTRFSLTNLSVSITFRIRGITPSAEMILSVLTETYLLAYMEYEWLRLRGVTTEADTEDATSPATVRIMKCTEGIKNICSVRIASPRRVPPL